MLDADEVAFVLAVTNLFTRDWLADLIKSTVKRVLTWITARKAEVRFVVAHDLG